MLTRTVVLLTLTSLVSACNSVTCGDGTFSDGDTCVGYDPKDKTAPVTTATPPGGRSREALPDTVQLVTDEPAKIFYTTDGSDPDPMMQAGETSPVTIVDITSGMTIKWFAIDRAGNREEMHSTVFDSDTTPPAPVSNFAITFNGSTAQLSWTAPTDADYAGTAIARIGDVVDAEPVAGMTITPGMLSPSVQVLQAGTGTSASDPGRIPGPIRYVAWSYDDLGNYSVPVVASAELAVGSLTAQLTYDTTNNTLAMPTVPANIALTGTTAALSGTTLTVSLKLTNNTNKYFHNFKAEVASATNATFTGSDGTADGLPFKYFGPNAFGPGASVTKDLTFTVTAGTTATINLTLADHATMVTARGSRTQQVNLLDTGSGLNQPPLTTTIRGPNDRAGGHMHPAILTGGRFLDVPHSHGAIERFDLTTGMRTGSVVLGVGDRNNVQFVTSTGADLIACIKKAGHRNSGQLELIRLDENLKVKQRADLVGATDDRGTTIPAISPDGRVLAIAANGGVFLIDLATMQPIDAVPATTLVDPVAVPLQQRARGVVFFNNGSGMVIAAKQGGQVAILEKTASGWTSSIYQDSNTGRGYSEALAPNGKVWVAQQTGVRAYDPTTKQWSTVGYPNLPYALNVINGQMWITRQDKVTVDQVSATGAVQRTITLPSQALGHWAVGLR